MEQFEPPPPPPHVPAALERDEFRQRFAQSFSDPRFDGLRDAVDALEELAWRHYCEKRGAPGDVPG